MASAEPLSPLRQWTNPNLAHVGGFEALEDEYSYKISNGEIRGRIPEAVRGTFFRIGPGRNKIGGQKFGHWFDGDGMMHALTFTDDGAWYRNRYVRTPKYLKETAEQRIVYRSFGHNAPGGILKNIGRPPANCANTSMVWHGGHLLALWEGGRPWKLDPVTLETIGEFDYDGALKLWDPFSAHGSVHPETGNYYNHGVSMGLKGPEIHFYEVNPAGRMTRKGRFPVERMAFIHDFGFTSRHMVFLAHPLGMESVVPFISGRKAFDECIQYRPDWGMKAYVVSLESFKLVKTFELDPFAVFHYSNCYEQGDELQIELVRFEDFDVAEALRNIFTHENQEAGRPWRLTFNLRTGQVSDEALPHEMSCEFPQWDHRYSTQKTRMIYSAAIVANETPGFFNAVQRIDTETGETRVHDLGPGRFTSEVMFVPEKEGEGEGYLCAAIYDAARHRSEIVLFDARSDSLEEVAAVPLRNHIPFGFHCGYWDKAFLPGN